jgi:pimeloyl-ACP methyl ester carboxylesterase
MSARRKGFLEKLSKFPISSLRYIAAHMVGRRLIYPGSLMLLNLAVAEPSSRGRATYKRKYDAHRARLLASDGNQLDCMFVDRRGSPDVTARGNRLVICCEGNAAYYELGLLEVPAKAGYSVLGWNHPGFGDSTGLPFPSQEFNAVDVVVRYAVTDLGFAFQDIIVYAWSIGGYTASCAAMSYPDIGAVVLDASFDDLFPLAQRRIPPAFVSFTHGMVREYYDLNIGEQMCRYSGPVLIVRRTEDEMMSINGEVGTNRSNHLLVKILQHRYPSLATAQSLPSLWNWLHAETEEERTLLTVSMNPRVCSSKFKSYMSEFGSSYPWTIGNGMPLSEKVELLLFLAGQYMVNYESTHCVILPTDYFRVPPPGNIQ